MPITGIQGQTLEVTVVKCTELKYTTQWFRRQDPYVCLEYASTKHKTQICTGGGKNPEFQEKFVFSLIEGLREINVTVWNHHRVRRHNLIGSTKVQLDKVLSVGFDDTSRTLQTKTGRHAGEVKLTLHYANAQTPASSCPHSTPPPSAYPPPPPHYPPPPTTYPPHPCPHYPPPPPTPPSACPPPPYPPPQPDSTYHAPGPYPGMYPPPPL